VVRRLEAEAAEILNMTQELESLTKDTQPGALARGLEWGRGRPWSRLRSFGTCWMSWEGRWVNKGKNRAGA